MIFRRILTNKQSKFSYFSSLRSIFIISLSTMLSLSILGPSFLMLIDHHCDIEVALDFGEEENKKDTKKELDENDTFFELYATPIIAKDCHKNLQNNHILHQYRNHIIDVQSPPPKYTT